MLLDMISYLACSLVITCLATYTIFLYGDNLILGFVISFGSV